MSEILITIQLVEQRLQFKTAVLLSAFVDKLRCSYLNTASRRLTILAISQHVPAVCSTDTDNLW